MRTICFSFLLLIFFLFCAPPGYNKYPEAQSIDQGSIAAVDEESYESANSDPNIVDRKIIIDAEIIIGTKFPDSVHTGVIEIARNNMGYVLKTNNNKTIIRIPSTKFYKVLNGLEALGEIRSKEISGEDVTDRYYDLEIRLSSAEKIRTRYLELLNQARSVDESLKIEREIERLNKEIDLYKGKMKQIGHLTQFSTITIITKDIIKPGPIGWVFKGIYLAVKWLFVWD